MYNLINVDIKKNSYMIIITQIINICLIYFKFFIYIYRNKTILQICIKKTFIV